MATALDVATRGLKLLIVEAEDSPLEASELADFYTAMNNLMADLEANDIRLGYTPVSTGSDEVTIPAGALRGLITNAALEAAPDYDATPSPELIRQAKESMQTLRRLGQVPIRSSYPSTLPRGTGNEDYPYLEARLFKPSPEGVLWLAGNTQASVIANVNVPVKVKGNWSTPGFEVYLVDVTGRVINRTDEEWISQVRLTATATAPSPVSANLILMRNGAERVASVAVSLSTARVDASLTSSVTLHPGEYLELWVENTTDDADITVADAIIEVI